MLIYRRTKEEKRSKGDKKPVNGLTLENRMHTVLLRILVFGQMPFLRIQLDAKRIFKQFGNSEVLIKSIDL